MRLLVPLIAITVFGLTSCCCPVRYCKEDKLETRKDLWGPTKVEGPYTRMLKRGIPKPASPFDAPADTAGKSVKSTRGYSK